MSKSNNIYNKHIHVLVFNESNQINISDIYICMDICGNKLLTYLLYYLFSYVASIPLCQVYIFQALFTLADFVSAKIA